MGTSRKLGHALLTVLLLGLTSCGNSPRPKVALVEPAPPTFRWEGPGRWSEDSRSLHEFVVIERPRGDPGFRDIFGDDSRHNPNVVWRIEPLGGGIAFGDAPDITYGQVPRGWRQTHPRSAPPPALIEGETYYAGQPFTSEDATLIFTVRSGKAVPGI